MIKQCVICTADFEPKRSDGIYCSAKCRRKPWNDRHPNYHVEYVKKNNERVKQYKEKWNRSEKGVVNRRCWYLAHKEEVFERNKAKPDHRIDQNYGKIARKTLTRHQTKECAVCKAVDVLIDAHHKDRDRSNNSIDNLVWLCRKCHSVEHVRLNAPTFL